MSAGWSARQQAMLDAMGIRLWPQRPAAAPPHPAAPVPSPHPPARAQGDTDAPATPLPATPLPATLPPATLPPATLPPAPPAAPATPGTLPDPAPGPTDAGDLDWPELRATVATCTACALSQTRTQTVFGVGHPQAHWMIIGEAPGEEEDRRGEPFVGRSGRLLDSMLAAAGLTRAPADAARQVYIANTVKCRPPGNRNPLPDELERCEGYLRRQIELVRPRIIVAMGRYALQTMLRTTEPVGRLRGRVHDYLGVPLIVTYHPAYLLRQPLDKARAWDDLCLAIETLQQRPPAAS